MPELSRFYHIVIKILFSDDTHHIHVYYNEHEASIGVDGELLSGSLPVKQIRLVLAWMTIHEEELYSTQLGTRRPFGKIEPLR